MSTVWSCLKKGFLVVFGVLLACLVIEGVLRVYNPFGVRVRGDEIVLPKNQSYTIPNNSIESLPSTIHHTKNSLGFRGPEPPENYDEHLTLITVGGSTTECFYLPDGKGWPAQLRQSLSEKFENLWLNNAGLDGHSTYGHLHLMEQYLVDLKPDVVVFLIGHNDMGLEAPQKFDRQINTDIRFSLNQPKEMIRGIINRSELLSLVFTAYKHYMFRSEGMGHGSVDMNTVARVGGDTVPRTVLDEHRTQYLPGYRSRVNKLVDLARDNGIEPVFFTQPVLYGEGTDPQSGVSLETVKRGGMSGNRRWQILELYNDVTRKVAETRDVPLVDMAHRMPKNSRYYYDFVHYNIEGASVFKDEAFQPLCEILARRFPNQQIEQCE